MYKDLHKSLGFTLVEAMAVIVVMSILLLISVISYDKIQDSTVTSKNKSNSILIKQIADIYNSENSTYPGTIQQFYLGGKLAKLPKEASLIADSDVSPINQHTGIETIAYSCMSSCVSKNIKGGRLRYWDFTTDTLKYIYLGEATESSNWDYPQKLISITTGGDSTCGISNDEYAYCWGGGGYGQLGISDGVSDIRSLSPKPIDYSGVLMNKKIKQVSANSVSTCALSTVGKVYCWGNGYTGSLGNNSLNRYVSPQSTEMNGALSGKTVLSLSESSQSEFFCAVASDSKVYCWGIGANGRLGNGMTDTQPTPVAVSDSGLLNGKTITKVTTGGYHSCAISTEVKIYCWGYNGYGQLGNNSTIQSLVPVQVDTTGVLNGKTIVDISLGEQHSCAIDNIGNTYCWGLNNNGQLGNNSTIQSLVPVQVDSTGVLNGKVAKTISLGFRHSCIADAAGDAYCWGYNFNGELGNITGQTSNLIPVAVLKYSTMAGKFIRSISASYYYTCFNTSDDKVFCSGRNDNVALGTGSTTPSYSYYPLPTNMNGELAGYGIKSISSGKSGASCAVTTNEKVFCWGSNYNGQLGNGINPDKWVPTRIDKGEISNKVIKSIKIAGSIGCALDDISKLYCWGYNNAGQAGTNSSESYVLNPTEIYTSEYLAGKTILDYSLSIQNVCIIASDKLIYCWGINNNGELGSGSNFYSRKPNPVTTSGVISGKTFKQISTGGNFSCALSTEGSVYCWGDNTYGQLGNNSTTSSLVPVAVDMSGELNGKTIKTISSGGNHVCAIASDDKLYCWGRNGLGALGDNTFIQKTTPTSVYTNGILSGKNITKISSGYYHTCAITTENKAYCWGYNSNGQLGRNNKTSSAAPISIDTSNIPLGRIISDISASDFSTCIITNLNEPYCWGSNASGQFGNGSQSDSLIPIGTYM